MRYFTLESFTRKNMKDEKLDLAAETALLSRRVKGSNSLFRAFMKGIFSGVGTAMGATLVAAGVLYVVWGFMQKTGLDKYMNPDAIDQLIQLQENVKQVTGEENTDPPIR